MWGADERVFGGGVHDDVKLTRELAPLVAAAEAAGTILVDASPAERKLLGRHVQSQADGEKALAKGQGDWVEPEFQYEDDGTKTMLRAGYYTGGWQHGNLLQAVLDREDRLKVLLQRTDLTRDEKAAQIETVEGELADLRARLADTKAPT